MLRYQIQIFINTHYSIQIIQVTIKVSNRYVITEQVLSLYWVSIETLPAKTKAIINAILYKGDNEICVFVRIEWKIVKIILFH